MQGFSPSNRPVPMGGSLTGLPTQPYVLPTSSTFGAPYNTVPYVP